MPSRILGCVRYANVNVAYTLYARANSFGCAYALRHSDSSSILIAGHVCSYIRYVHTFTFISLALVFAFNYRNYRKRVTQCNANREHGSICWCLRFYSISLLPTSWCSTLLYTFSISFTFTFTFSVFTLPLYLPSIANLR